MHIGRSIGESRRPGLPPAVPITVHLLKLAASSFVYPSHYSRFHSLVVSLTGLLLLLLRGGIAFSLLLFLGWRLRQFVW